MYIRNIHKDDIGLLMDLLNGFVSDGDLLRIKNCLKSNDIEQIIFTRDRSIKIELAPFVESIEILRK